jgi:hypothetical protein
MEASRRIELLYTDLQSARFWLFLNGFLCTKPKEHTRNIPRMCDRGKYSDEILEVCYADTAITIE